MATTHHPASTSGFGQHHEWLWIAIGAVVIAIVAVAITWAVTQPEAETTAATTAVVFEYDHEVTPMHMVEGRVTTPYFGYSGELWPEGSEYDHEVTSMHMLEGRVTTPYFGNSGELDADK